LGLLPHNVVFHFGLIVLIKQFALSS